MSQNELVVLARDLDENGALTRAYFACVDGTAPKRLASPAEAPDAASVLFLITPTKTYSEGMGGGGSERSPEDRSVWRALSTRFGDKASCVLAYGAKGDEHGGPASFFEFHPGMLRRVPELLREQWTVPNRQDYMYLATKTFGLNLVVRVFFMILPVRNGGLALARAAAALTWYQLQDTIFTVFGQTYMKFLGRMTNMLRVGPVWLGDFSFVYVQLCFFEFLNRLVLGPLGQNPLVYTWHGMGLIFVNIIQGMISGGPLIPAINKMRRAGVISHSTMMHCYQLSSLTMQFGLFASFGYQYFYFLLTSATLVLSWGSYALFSLFFLDPPRRAAEQALADRLLAATS
ncbi:MAG: hypothetical protein COV48_10890 [Elusimicrobia bacterium CG11_big_fil_rev_8_21_14_0_20_64_6]|nr:MAG: hypothetical protein COV48_10890 [Elusimicrobia bacterium CG11_big_fil_rev_8_21_14_0_20_64_6]